ncbi:MAG: SUMF1/EgtB/PvdO family nonheme iron enzyme [Gammaproteobacteria bacterium]|nr:SUMF1/EgtB/PvdO family nonheme iron enzyme [Gammaproteobacteria bacterium]MBU1408797.1 SUMF1/EgtB/PvdO family nonheme iron enzyme [Gammaproteobacteria bacterium]MBU1532634.1 SUMF1/EgtB/PvdO family nonheme iron enzyme [Gammaproteobacteria bacterium]
MKSLLFVFAVLFVLPAHADSMLRISCEEQDLGAEITLNGEFKGECPLDLKVKPGKLIIDLKKPINEDYEKHFIKEMRIGDGVVQKIEAKFYVFVTPARAERIQKEKSASAARFNERVYVIAPVLAEYQQNDIKPGNGKTFKDCDTCPEMLLIPSTGGVWIGDGTKSNHYVHIVAFALARTEVTQAQWQVLMGNNPSRFKECGGDCPVENVSWHDAQAYVKKLAEVTGKPYRLPSESEWEYACGAGKDDKYCGGNDLDAVVAKIEGYNAKTSTSDDKTKTVGQKAPNAWGLFDMSGNVSEWVEDCLHYNYFANNGAPDDGSAWTSYPRDLNPNAIKGWWGSCDKARVLRGGGGMVSRYVDGSTNMERTRQESRKPEDRYHYRGFRVAMTLDMTEQDMPRYVERDCKRKADAHAKSRLGEVVSVDRNAQRLELKLDAPAAKDGNLYGYVLTKEHTRLYPKLNVTAGATNFVLTEKSLDGVSMGDVYYATRYTSGCWGSTAYCALAKQTCPTYW